MNNSVQYASFSGYRALAKVELTSYEGSILYSFPLLVSPPRERVAAMQLSNLGHLTLRFTRKLSGLLLLITSIENQKKYNVIM